MAYPVAELSKLQRIQNTAARLVARVKKSDHISPVLRNLHWLPVRSRIIFKILLITFKALHGQAPIYITDLLTRYNPTRTLRSSNQNLLLEPKSKTVTHGDRTFSVAAPKLWNSLPQEIRSIDHLSSFKSAL